MKRTRVALIGMRPRLREIVADALAREPDLEVVAIESLDTNLVDGLDIDVVIIGTPYPDDAGPPGDVLTRLPRARVLMIATSARRAVMYRLRPEKLAIAEVSTESLVKTIRGDG